MNIVFYQLYASYLWKALDQEAQTLQSEIWQKRSEWAQNRWAEGSSSTERQQVGGLDGSARERGLISRREDGKDWRTLRFLMLQENIERLPPCPLPLNRSLFDKDMFFYFGWKKWFWLFELWLSVLWKKNAILSNALNSFHQTHIYKDSAKWIISSL